MPGTPAPDLGQADLGATPTKGTTFPLPMSPTNRSTSTTSSTLDVTQPSHAQPSSTMGAGFSLDQIPTLTGRNFVITGANTGIGWITAREIAKHGGNVILACRSQEKAEAAIAKIQSELAAGGTPSSEIGTLEFLPLDLQSLKSCAKAARTLRDRNHRIDVLINNAGIMATPFALTKDGIESQFGTNHMGHFVFTMLLLPLIPKDEDAKSRIVILSSFGHTLPYSTGLLELDQIMVSQDGSSAKLEAVYATWAAYGQSKLANLLFAKYLARHLPSSVQCFAVHPGYVDTDLGRNLSSSHGSIVGTVAKGLAAVVAKSPESGAITTLCAATHPKWELSKGIRWAPSGTYFVPEGKVGTPSKFAMDERLGDKLWEMSLEIVRRVLGEKVSEEIKGNIQA
ncbi:hypothetical protein BCR44DRAFT_1432439 [Catenaria anguillulae PL171]|uniref:Uncharacterized protein n=1 Tax=Catenaria anguillulae PL171 TaxID=765915 RepID=A0A1Y2HP49_9FUNG|nr:hypothetical protein BCR44DRAFT_1432439 [Catenaria anguillulae PL171]